ncbi:uncharacterized protein LOC131875903 [Cryptomeria japonica]|uniref:uncharacterized protein LOC131875903 n=1 Tax=Cryptomeria japonica TaxID=3369 RepID=UPI0027D9EB47|nr:uncharacterized protein LOC131875903 [Cryptomeria japonica]
MSLRLNIRIGKAIRWKASPRDWTKLNFDGASKGNPGESGIGAIIRDEQGNILQGLFGGIGVATNNEVEICALEAGLCLCIRALENVIESYEIGHVYKEDNQVANYLGNLGVGGNDDLVYFCQASASEDIKGQCRKDCQRYQR